MTIVKSLINVAEVAEMLGGCSKRHVMRLANAGKMPAPVRLGGLVRWNRAEIETWIADGCEPVQAATEGGDDR